MSIFNEQPSNYRVLFLDMDAFFAKCEQEVDSSLRGKPIGVTPQLVRTGCVIAPSYEAKQQGVKTGMPVFEAQRVCPELILVEAQPKLYKQFHYQIRDILEATSPWVDAKSIDEFSMKLSHREQDYFASHAVGVHIKKEIRQRIGSWVTCSVGIGPNYFLAKMAAETHKPDGLASITLESAQNELGSLDLTDLCGVARGISRRLRAEGIFSVSDFFQTEAKQLRQIFGFIGELWWYRLHGYEVDDIQFTRSHIGHSHVLAPEWRNPRRAEHVLNRLAHKVGQRLRKEGYWARQSYLSIEYMGGGYYHNHLTSMPYCDSYTMMHQAHQLFDLRPTPDRDILHLSFHVTGLARGMAHPEPLFPEMQRSLHLTRALDKINDKFGRDTIFSASMLGAKDTAPDRIPFGRLRY